MIVVQYPDEMKNLALSYRLSGKSIGLVPTMGALHTGHLSLLDIAQKTADITVMSIFVNPKQFGPNEDLNSYPRTFEEDRGKAEEAGCDIVFAPHESNMYPTGYSTYVSVENFTERLCGASRPDHFRGVTTIVLKLFNITMPHSAVFGQKDAQQALVLRRMCEDLNVSVEMIIAPIVREADGLAMSSRNAYLTPSERKEVPLIYKGLKKVEKAFETGERDAVRLYAEIKQVYSQAECFSPEYIELVDTETLLSVREITDPALVAVACRTVESQTRLIDNIVLGGAL